MNTASREAFEKVVSLVPWIVYDEGKDTYRLSDSACVSEVNYNILLTYKRDWALWKQAISNSAQPKLKVVIRSFPESNGKRNWTAMLMRVEPFDKLIGNAGGITIARGEYWNQVAYHAERTKVLIGEREDEPSIDDYAEDIKTPDEWKGETK
jgi:hypothetical protein